MIFQKANSDRKSIGSIARQDIRWDSRGGVLIKTGPFRFAGFPPSETVACRARNCWRGGHRSAGLLRACFSLSREAGRFLVCRRTFLILVRQGDTKADTEGDGQDDEEDDEGAPPLELAAVAGVLVGLLDLLVALLDVLDGVLGVVLGRLDDGVLLLDDGREVLVQRGELEEGLLDALELVVPGSDVAEDGARVASPVGS